MLEIQLGSRVRHQRSVRQYRSRTLATGCPETREMQMGAAVHRTVADGADGIRGWDEGRAYAWYPSRWRYQPDSRESVHALQGVRTSLMLPAGESPVPTRGMSRPTGNRALGSWRQRHGLSVGRATRGP